MKLPFAAADCETDPFKYERVPQPFVIGHRTLGEYVYFWGDDCVSQYVAFIRDRKEKVYFHNGGRFDLYFFVDYADEIFMIKNRIAKLRIGDCYLLDSFLLIPVPLALGGEKDTSFDYSILERDQRRRNRLKILDYLRQDCDALYNWLEIYDEELTLGKMTLASVGVDKLRKLNYTIPDLSESNDELIRAYYYGGMVGFKRGTYYDYTYIDINSSYPFAMLSRHPWGTALEKSIYPTAPNYFTTIKCRACGLLPVRRKGRLLYPDNEIVTYRLTNWELDAATELGLIDDYETIESLSFHETTDFKDFVEFGFAGKAKAETEGNTPKRTLYKLLLNSVYGKFGINPRKYESYTITPLGEVPDDPDFYWIMDTENDNTIWAKHDPGDRYLNVATSASITGLARANLIRAICAVDHPVYWDTDSLICRGSGSLVLGDDIGEWSTEAVFQKVQIIAPKIYGGLTVDGKIKTASKGVRLSLDQIDSLARGERVIWESQAPAFSLKHAPTFTRRELQFLP